MASYSLHRLGSLSESELIALIPQKNGIDDWKASGYLALGILRLKYDQLTISDFIRVCTVV